MFDKQAPGLGQQLAQVAGDDPQLQEFGQRIVDTIGKCTDPIDTRRPVTFRGPVDFAAVNDPPRFRKNPFMGNANTPGYLLPVTLDDDLTGDSPIESVKATINSWTPTGQRETSEKLDVWPGLLVPSGRQIASGSLVYVANVGDRWVPVQTEEGLAAVGSGGVFRFKNTASETLPAHGVMRVTGVTTVNGVYHLSAAKPNLTWYETYYVNGPSDVLQNATGICYKLFGGSLTIPVLYDSGLGSPSAEQFWGPKNNQWSLAPDRYHFRILGSAGTGLVFASQEFDGTVEGYCGDPLSAGGSQTMTIRDTANASNVASVTVYDKYLRTGVTIPASTWITAQRVGGIYRVLTWGCAS